jgi:O-acetyl-ADP-ribose deacetylase (regulator of RNase III)
VGFAVLVGTAAGFLGCPFGEYTKITKEKIHSTLEKLSTSYFVRFTKIINTFTLMIH